MIRMLRYSPLLLLLAAAPGDYKIGAPPLRLLPSTTLAGEQLVTPGAIVAKSMLGRPDAAIMADSVNLAQAGEKRAFPRGTVLAATNVRGLPGEQERVFCEERQEGSTAKMMTGQMLFGLVGALRSTKQDTQYCLIDAEKDSFFESAFLIGAKGKAKLPYAIPKAEYGLIKGMSLGGDAMVRLRYVGTAGAKDAVAFDLEAIGFGRMRALPGARHVVSIAKLPAHEIIAGAVLTVLAYDAKSGAATIVINRDLAPGHIVLPEMVE